MADTEDTTPASSGDGQPPRDSTSGRYASRHEPKGEGDTGEPAEKDEKEGKKRWLLLLLLLLILLLLICAGAAYMRWWRKDDPAPVTSPTAVSTATTKPTPTAAASASASPSPSVSPSPKTVAMPNVVGKPAAEAKTILEAAGLGNIKFVAEDKPDEGLTLLVSYVVTKQSVAAGTQVPVNTAVVITCKSSSNGKG